MTYHTVGEYCECELTTALFGGERTKYNAGFDLAVLGNRNLEILPQIDAASLGMSRASDDFEPIIGNVERAVLVTMINSALAKSKEFWDDCSSEDEDTEPLVIVENVRRITEKAA